MPGQRWVSDMEPELGLGIVIRVANRRVSLFFRQADAIREYASNGAPLHRVRFQVGDTIRDHDNNTILVERVEETGGVITYHGAGKSLSESLLAESHSVSEPIEQLLSGQWGPGHHFDLRRRSWRARQQSSQSPLRGLLGGRLSLIPHQFFIADDIASRLLPRVLLADEVGLGKTIEACLLLHRLLITGRITRVLIVLPESLVHQWFVELLRKFNLTFALIDEDYYQSLDKTSDENPFLNEQLVICHRRFLRKQPQRKAVVDSGWDLVLVDEAHQIRPDTVDFELLSALSKATSRLILLTATPERLGVDEHFQRLRLLDPLRFPNLDSYKQEADKYRQLAELLEPLHAGKVDRGNLKKIKQLFPGAGSLIRDTIASAEDSEESTAGQLFEALLDLHGPGRQIYRNSRAVIGGFPPRRFNEVLLKGAGKDDPALELELREDWGRDDVRYDPDYQADARVRWLAAMLRDHPTEKFLVICRTRLRAVAIQTTLQNIVSVNAAAFHEGLSLVQRDRHAAWFAQKDGAQVLICSEIGSEGRNFQFCHNLILFDLPLDPDLLEQRIGRLDRIGQEKDIMIYWPVAEDAPQLTIGRWLHHGCNAFERHGHGVRLVWEKWRDRMYQLCFFRGSGSEEDLEKAISAARDDLATIEQELEGGRDRLLEWRSWHQNQGAEITAAIKEVDKSPELQRLMQGLWEHFGVAAGELGDRFYRLNAGSLKVDAFPNLPESGLTLTFQRKTAVEREDVAFLSWDHPMVSGAMDMLLGSTDGTIAAMRVASESSGTFETRVELLFVLECIAPDHLYVDRFLPSQSIHLVVDEKLELTDVDWKVIGTIAAGAEARELMENVSRETLQDMITAGQQHAEREFAELRKRAIYTARQAIQLEINRLEAIGKRDGLRPVKEINAFKAELKAVNSHIDSARVRLDAIRLIVFDDQDSVLY